jgi:hypothetical protein
LVTRRVKRCLVAGDRNTISQLTDGLIGNIPLELFREKSDEPDIFGLLSDAGSGS